MSKPFLSRVCQIVNLLALSVWLGSVAMSGVVAAKVFPLMRELQPTLASFPDYEGDHALLTAGQVASSIFFIVDTIQFICATLALGSLVALVVMGYSLNTLARVARVVLLCMTLALLSYHLFVFMPGFEGTLRAYWDFAHAGDTVQADALKDQFLQSHPTASRLIGGLTIMVLINIVVAGWTLTAGEMKTEKAA